eukprot:132163_1
MSVHVGTGVGANGLFNVLDLIAGTVQVIYGFILYNDDFEGYIIPIYLVFFGGLIIIMVFYIPKRLLRQIPFYQHFLGRSIFFLFFALLVIDPWGFGLFGGAYIGLVSLIYFIVWLTNKCNCTNIVLPPPFFFSSDDSEHYAEYTRTLAKSITASQYNIVYDISQQKTEDDDMFT